MKASHFTRTFLVPAVLASLLLSAPFASAQSGEVLHMYGPGGPAPAMQEAAEAFGKANDIKIEVVAGPTGKWLEKAKADADLIYSGAEYQMTDLSRAMPDQIDPTTAVPLYLRPASILVRPGNPKKINGFSDLLKPGMKIMVVSGAGQTGLWEDVAGRKGNIGTVRAFRKNIAVDATNSVEAKKIWIEKKEIDAWLIWNIWQVSNPELAALVPVEKSYAIYRDTAIAVTKQGNDKELSSKFVAFLQSPEGAQIFKKWGWLTSQK